MALALTNEERLSSEALAWLEVAPLGPIESLDFSEARARHDIREASAFFEANGPVGRGVIWEQFLKQTFEAFETETRELHRRFALLPPGAAPHVTDPNDAALEKRILQVKWIVWLKLRMLRTPLEDASPDTVKVLCELREQSHYDRKPPAAPPPPIDIEMLLRCASSDDVAVSWEAKQALQTLRQANEGRPQQNKLPWRRPTVIELDGYRSHRHDRPSGETRADGGSTAKVIPLDHHRSRSESEQRVSSVSGANTSKLLNLSDDVLLHGGSNNNREVQEALECVQEELRLLEEMPERPAWQTMLLTREGRQQEPQRAEKWAMTAVADHVPNRAGAKFVKSASQLTSGEFLRFLNEVKIETLVDRKLFSWKASNDDAIKAQRKRYFQRLKCIEVARKLFPDGFPTEFDHECEQKLEVGLRQAKIRANDARKFIGRVKEAIGEQIRRD